MEIALPLFRRRQTSSASFRGAVRTLGATARDRRSILTAVMGRHFSRRGRVRTRSRPLQDGRARSDATVLGVVAGDQRAGALTAAPMVGILAVQRWTTQSSSGTPSKNQIEYQLGL